MFRLFALLSIAAGLLARLVSPLSMAQLGMFVVGGSHHIHAGESLKEDVRFYFAQVTVDKGASIDGKVFLFSSTLDLGGHVSKDIRALESDLTLRQSAEVDGEIGEKDLIHWTVLLPTVAQLP